MQPNHCKHLDTHFPNCLVSYTSNDFWFFVQVMSCETVCSSLSSTTSSHQHPLVLSLSSSSICLQSLLASVVCLRPFPARGLPICTNNNYYDAQFVLLFPLNDLGQLDGHYFHWLLQLSLSRISESTTGYTFTPCVGSFTSPGIRVGTFFPPW